MIVRRQFRGCLKSEAVGKKESIEFADAVKEAKRRAAVLIERGRLLLAALFCHESMCFLYFEALDAAVDPEAFLGPLEPYLERWPEETGMTAWAFMYGVYYHCIPGTVGDWEKNRSGKSRIGRIAFLYPEKIMSYLYWHRAIVEEGLFQGDRYQYISLHENILFSYFEEPKQMTNIRCLEMESKVIGTWMQQEPAAHFDRGKTQGNNFMVIPALFTIGRSDL